MLAGDGVWERWAPPGSEVRGHFQSTSAFTLHISQSDNTRIKFMNPRTGLPDDGFIVLSVAFSKEGGEYEYRINIMG